MNKTLKRATSGLAYVIVMWYGASYSVLSYRVLFIILGILSVYEMSKLREGKHKITAFIYVLVPFILAQFIITPEAQENWNPNVILFMFILVFTFDTFAYLIGLPFGRHKILPSISPKKSWEGFFGGSVATIVLAYFTYPYFTFENSRLALIMSIALPFTATIGDFIESYYKRESGVKDSGNIIPGHGGILDRMDSFMVTIPVIYIIIKLL